MKIFHMVHLNPVSNPVGLHVRKLMTAAATWILIALPLSHSCPSLASGREADPLLRSGWLPSSVTSNASLSHCEWPSISCDVAGSVVRVHLPQQDYNHRFTRHLRRMNYSLLPNLASLRLPRNYLSDFIPLQLCALPKLRHLNLSRNSLINEIPLCLQNLNVLEVLDIHSNLVASPVPPELGNLKSLIYLDLRSNALWGMIPPTLGHTAYIDLLYNHLTGKIPDNLAHFDYGVFEGNESLEKTNGSRRMSRVTLTMVLIPLTAILIMSYLVLGHLIIFRGRMTSMQSETVAKNGDFLSIWNYGGRIAYEDIINATEDFDIKYCIGTGGYGSVYKARLPNGKIKALKKLHHLEAEDPSFDESLRNEVKRLTEV